MKRLSPIILGTAILLLWPSGVVTARGSTKKKQSSNRVLPHIRMTAAQEKLLETRKRLIEKTKASRDDLEKLLGGYEEQSESQAADYETTESLYEKGLMDKAKLDDVKTELANTRVKIEQVRRWIDEDNVALALTEEGKHTAVDGLADVPSTRRNGQPMTLIRYTGFTDWSLADASEIKSFFLERFGYDLPISAFGQSATHTRMGLDHREAMDVAVRPDSEEGKALMTYLREEGIPFIAFSNRLPGWATGAHIHIGRPSLRLEQAKLSHSYSVRNLKIVGRRMARRRFRSRYRNRQVATKGRLLESRHLKTARLHSHRA